MPEFRSSEGNGTGRFRLFQTMQIALNCFTAPMHDIAKCGEPVLENREGKQIIGKTTSTRLFASSATNFACDYIIL
jgi:hypothetical protein